VEELLLLVFAFYFTCNDELQFPDDSSGWFAGPKNNLQNYAKNTVSSSRLFLKS
jgi:hypothetical protein